MWEQEKRIVFEVSVKLKEAGMVAGSQGNISARFKDSGCQLVAITPSGIDYSLMKPDDIAIVDSSGKLVDGTKKPSIEMMLHLAIYQKREDVAAVIHSHSVYATALAVSTARIPPILDDQIIYLGGEIAVAKHALPGSGELAQNVADALSDRNAVLMANHGALVTGNTMAQAFFNCQLLERLARIYIYSRMLGNKRELPADIVRREQEMFGAGGDASI